MTFEIERKFLVNNDSFLKKFYKKSYIKQGFLNTDKNRTVRIRIIDNLGFITVKGKSSENGLKRLEWEKEISISEAQTLLNLSESTPIEKYRYLVKNDPFIFEVDVFLGENKGLVIAEIELNTENDTFNKPNWIGKEVTGEVKYYNSCLSKKPFSTWP